MPHSLSILNNVPRCCCCVMKHLTALAALRQIWQQWKMIQDHCLLLQWKDESAMDKKRDTWMTIKVLGARVRIKFLYSELQASLSCSEGHLLFMLPSFHFFFFFVLPGPSSHIPWLWPLLRTAPQFNLPNAVMGQANQPPVRLRGTAKQIQLCCTLLKCHDDISDITRPTCTFCFHITHV